MTNVAAILRARGGREEKKAAHLNVERGISLISIFYPAEPTACTT
jgi:hypothetical protein